jgi:Tol biopolymer transport system component
MIKKFAFIVFILAFTSNILPQKKAFTIEDLYKIKSVGSAVISNDGKQFLFTVTNYDLPKSNSNTEVYLSNIDGSNQRKITNNKAADFSPIWDKDSKGFYFVSYRTGSAQLFYLPLDGGEARQITDFYMGINSPKISPDGTKIIFSTKVFPEIGID